MKRYADRDGGAELAAHLWTKIGVLLLLVSLLSLMGLGGFFDGVVALY